MRTLPVVLLALFSSASALHCSNACNACCPQAGDGTNLTPDEEGYCVDALGEAQCRLCGDGHDACPQREAPRVLLQTAEGGVQGTSGYAYSGMPAWNGSFADSRIFDIPPRFASSAVMTVPQSHVLPAATNITYTCPNYSNAEPCTMIVFMYECNPCESKKGGLPSLLTSLGWLRSRCAPNFVLGRTEVNLNAHRMTTFTKTLAPGAVDTFHTQGTVEYTFFGVTHGDAVDCAAKTSEASCESVEGFCAWTQGSCEINSCIQSGVGCNLATCVKREVKMMARLARKGKVE